MDPGHRGHLQASHGRARLDPAHSPQHPVGDIPGVLVSREGPSAPRQRISQSTPAAKSSARWEAAPVVPAWTYPMNIPTVPDTKVASTAESLVAPFRDRIRVVPAAWQPSVKNCSRIGFGSAAYFKIVSTPLSILEIRRRLDPPVVR